MLRSTYHKNTMATAKITLMASPTVKYTWLQCSSASAPVWALLAVTATKAIKMTASIKKPMVTLVLMVILTF